MTYIIVLICIILILFWYYDYKKQPTVIIDKPIVTITPPEPEVEYMESSWIDKVASKSLEPGIVESHREYSATTNQYSSGANFTSVADDNTADVFVNYTGFARPYYIPLNPHDKTIPSHDPEVLKRFKHITFK